MRESHVAQIAAPTYRMWAEPETGGESYIPLAPSKRGKSLAVWAETGRRLGAVPSAAGNVFDMGRGVLRAPWGGGQHATPAFDYQRLASAMSGQGIDYQRLATVLSSAVSDRIAAAAWRGKRGI